MPRALPPVTGRRGMVLALAAGAAWPLAFAPFGWYPVSVIALAALFHALEGQSPGAAFRRGYAFGLGAFAAGTWWVFNSIHDFGGVAWPLAAAITALMVLALAAFIGGFAWLAVRLSPPAGLMRWLIGLPAAWVLAEWVRSWLLSGFPWLSAGYAHTDSWLVSYAPLGGVFGISLVVALSAGAILAILRDPSRKDAAAAALGVLALAWFAGAAMQRVAWHEPVGEPLEVALLQGNVAQELKWDPEQLQPTVQLYHGMTLEHLDADIVVWPEAALPALAHQVDGYLDGLDALAREHSTAVVMGLLTRDEDAFHNSVLTFGDADGTYHKRKLVPFGEFFPVPGFVRSWLRLMNLPYTDFDRGGADQAPLTVAGHATGASICYEAAFGGWIRRSTAGAALMVNVSNDAWFGDSIAPHQHLQIARMRALENARWMLRATNTGVTAVIGPDGRITGRLEQFEPGVLRANVLPLSGTTPFARFGDWAVVVICSLLLIASMAASGAGRAAIALYCRDDG